MRDRLRTVRALAIAAASCLSLMACDPCASLQRCDVDGRRIDYGGQIVARETGRGVAGVEVSARLEGGGDGGIVRSVTNADGFFRLVGEANDVDSVTADISVMPPGGRGYTVRGLRLATSRSRGAGGELGRWTAHPYLALVGELVDRRTNAVIEWGGARLRRLGGVRVQPDSARADADIAGRFFFEGRADTLGDVELEVLVNSSTFPDATRTVVRVSTDYRDVPASRVTVIGGGPILRYGAEVVERGSNRRRAGVQVEFRRTGGVEAAPAIYRATTNASGWFPIALAPRTNGVVIGDLIIRAPESGRETVHRGIRLETNNDDRVPFAGVFGFGLQVFASVELVERASGSLVPQGTPVVFRRTGGISIVPELVPATVNQFGRFAIQASASDTGEVVGDVEVDLGATKGRDTIRGVRLTAREDDAQPFAGRWGVGAWYAWVGEVLGGPGATPLAGARIEFRRTGGAAVAQEVYEDVANVEGRFRLMPTPLTAGDVIGTLTIRPPAPYQVAVFPGIRLTQSRSDVTRLLEVWRLPSP